MTPSCTCSACPVFEMRSHGNSVVLAIAGDLTLATAAAARAAILEPLKGRPKRLVVDLTRVQCLDEAGIGCLVAASLWARKAGTEFGLIPSAGLWDRLTAARIDRYFVLVEPGSA